MGGVAVWCGMVDGGVGCDVVRVCVCVVSSNSWDGWRFVNLNLNPVDLNSKPTSPSLPTTPTHHHSPHSINPPYLSARSIHRACSAAAAAPCGSPACFNTLLRMLCNSITVGVWSMAFSTKVNAAPVLPK